MRGDDDSPRGRPTTAAPSLRVPRGTDSGISRPRDELRISPCDCLSDLGGPGRGTRTVVVAIRVRVAMAVRRPVHACSTRSQAVDCVTHCCQGLSS